MIMPKNRNIRMLVETTLSLKMERKPGSVTSSNFLLFLLNFPANLSVNQTPNICWCPTAKPPPSVKSCVASTVKFEKTDQYVPNKRPNMTMTPASCNSGKANKTSHKAVEDCCTMIWPVMNTVRTLVYLRKMTKTIFTMKAISKTITMRLNERPAPSIACCAAVCPK